MHNRICTYLLGSLLLVALAGPAPAQRPYQPPASREDEEDSYEDELEPGYSFFLNAHKDTPQDQLAYARALLEEGREGKALRQFRALVKKWKTTPEAARAQYMAGRLYHERGNEKKAAEAFRYLLARYAGEIPYQDVLTRLYDIGEVLLESRRGGLFFFGGFRSPEQSIPVFRTVVQYGPGWSNAPAAQLHIGEAHEAINDLEIAIKEYEAVLYRYPERPEAEVAAFRRAACLQKISDENPKSTRMAEEAYAAFVLFLEDYPLADNREEARARRNELRARMAEIAFERASFYQDYVRRPEAALREYRDFVKRYPRSKWTDEANSRIQELESELGDAAVPDTPETS